MAYYEADVVTANDYYPFGMIMPGRKYAASELYRYGFNGKENDNEVKGEGGQQDYGMRIYDPRLGRFLSVDPLSESFPWFSPYQFSGNSPITFIDLDGQEMSWRNPVTGEVKVAGPILLPIGSRNAEGWILFQPPIRRPAESISVSNPPIFKPALQQGSDYLASLKSAQNSQIALKTSKSKPPPPAQITATVGPDNRTGYERQLSAQYANQIAFNQEISGRAALDPISYGGPGFGLGLARDPLMQTSAMIVSPQASLFLGGLFTYQGIKTGDYSMTATGGLMMLGGGAGLYAKFTPGQRVLN